VSSGIVVAHKKPCERGQRVAVSYVRRCPINPHAQEENTIMSNSLFDRLGGTAGIGRIVDDVMAAHLSNPLIKTRFENAKDLDRAGRMAKEFLAAGSGGTAAYTGKDMLAAHKGMNISEQEFLSATDDILGALEKNKVGDDVKKDVLAILYSLKETIIRV
jgi:hemoglobin